jgi:hypothetical protein
LLEVTLLGKVQTKLDFLVIIFEGKVNEVVTLGSTPFFNVVGRRHFLLCVSLCFYIT